MQTWCPGFPDFKGNDKDNFLSYYENKYFKCYCENCKIFFYYEKKKICKKFKLICPNCFDKELKIK